MPFLTVIVLSYNQEDMVVNCLDSLLDSYCKDVQLVIADDASKDLTQEKISLWLAKNARFFESTCFLKNKKNIGTVKNLINAVNNSNAQIIKDIAADDWFLPNAIDKIRSFLDKNEKKFDVVFTPLEANCFDAKGNFISRNIIPASKVDAFFEKSLVEKLSDLVMKNVLRSPGAFFSKKFWDTIELDKTPIILVEDWAMWMLGIIRLQNYVYLDTIIVAYRQTQTSVSKNIYSENYRKYLVDCERTLNTIALKHVSLLPWQIKFKLLYTYVILYIVSKLPLKIIVLLKKFKIF